MSNRSFAQRTLIVRLFQPSAIILWCWSFCCTDFTFTFLLLPLDLCWDFFWSFWSFFFLYKEKGKKPASCILAVRSSNAQHNIEAMLFLLWLRMAIFGQSLFQMWIQWISGEKSGLHAAVMHCNLYDHPWICYCNRGIAHWPNTHLAWGGADLDSRQNMREGRSGWIGVAVLVGHGHGVLGWGIVRDGLEKWIGPKESGPNGEIAASLPVAPVGLAALAHATGRQPRGVFTL